MKNARKSLDLDNQTTEILSKLGIAIPELLVPITSLDPSTWAVVACDQYTSNPEYWASVEKICQNKPSSLHLTLPEIYLKANDLDLRIDHIVSNMKEYQSNGILESLGQACMFIERRTNSGLRQGLLVALDLEHYDFSPDSQTLIRATEGTIVDRIPPRLKIREKASLELPHIMVLIDDPKQTVLEKIPTLLQNNARYSFDLMKDGGSINGWPIQEASHIGQIATAFNDLYEEKRAHSENNNILFFAMGDGNHSLATAKTSWERIKKNSLSQGVSQADLMNHPARHALVEIVNIHSHGLRFEPIHRAIFTDAHEDYLNEIKKSSLVQNVQESSEAYIRSRLDQSEIGQRSLGIQSRLGWFLVELKADIATLAPGFADEAFSCLNKNHIDADIDFIHGWHEVKSLAEKGAIGVYLPVISRDALFSWVQKNGPLPRKAFSMGDAEEKRYYFEVRSII